MKWQVLLFFLWSSYCTYCQVGIIKKIEIIENRNAFQNSKTAIFKEIINKKLILGYDQNSFVVGIFNPANQTIKYQLQNFNARWFSTIDSRLIFTNIPSGEYILNISNESNTESIKIIIESPLWLRWWFLPSMFVYALVLISILLYFLFQYRLRQQLRTQLIRDSIARDLHDDIGSYLSSISILSQNVENLIQNNPEKARQSLQKIGNTARQVMDTMSDIVWSINPNQDSMEQIIGRMKDFSNELFFNQDLEINFQISENIKKINLTLEKRRDFFLIFKETFNNTYKYANATSIEVSIKIIENQIVMKITDDGNGFDKSKLTTNRTTGGNGFKNMQSRAEKLNGKLAIESQIGEGTSIKLSFAT